MNWQPLSSGDPLPGDPAAIQQLSSLLNTYATECSTSATKLTNLDDIDWQSDAASVFRQRKEAFVPKLTLVSERLSSSSSILGRFGVQLSNLQANGLTLRSAAQQLQDEIQAVAPLAQEQQDHIQRQEIGMVIGKPPIPWSGPDYLAQQSALRASFERVQNTFNELVSQYVADAQTCSQQLSQVSHDALANNLFSVFSHYLGDAGAFVDSDVEEFNYLLRDAGAFVVSDVEELNYLLPGAAKMLHYIANIAGIVSLIPGFEWAGVIFLAASALSLGADAILLAEHRDGVTWGTLGNDAFQVATAGVVNKANNMVRAAEDASHEVGVMDVVVSSAPDSDLASSAGDLEGFATRLPIESNTLNVLGQVDATISWTNDHVQFISRTLGQMRTSLAPDVMPLTRLAY